MSPVLHHNAEYHTDWYLPRYLVCKEFLAVAQGQLLPGVLQLSKSLQYPLSSDSARHLGTIVRRDGTDNGIQRSIENYPETGSCKILGLGKR
jgi:hypothetical protein